MLSFEVKTRSIFYLLLLKRMKIIWGASLSLILAKAVLSCFNPPFKSYLLYHNPVYGEEIKSLLAI